MRRLYQVAKKAQATIEYMLLFAMVAIIVFLSLKSLLPKAGVSSAVYFNQASGAIMGPPPPCFPPAELQDYVIDETNAADFLTYDSMGPNGAGYTHDCQQNNYNKWCVEDGDHWPQHLLGCYEIADDNGNQDCDLPNGGTWIVYRWDKVRYPIRKSTIDHVSISIDTADGPCGNQPGYENDDGWDDGPWTLTLTGNNWTDRDCDNGGDGGVVQAWVQFDANDLLDSVKVSARDHSDEGFFKVTGFSVIMLIPPNDC